MPEKYPEYRRQRAERRKTAPNSQKLIRKLLFQTIISLVIFLYLLCIKNFSLTKDLKFNQHFRQAITRETNSSQIMKNFKGLFNPASPKEGTTANAEK